MKKAPERSGVQRVESGCFVKLRLKTPAEFGDLVRYLRQGRGMNVESFALYTGINKGAASEMFNGKRPVTANLAIKVANAFSLPIEMVLCEKEAREA